MSNRGLVGWKRVESRRRTWAWAMALGGSLWMSAAQAQAQVFQTDPAKTPLPQPVGSAELSLGLTYGYDTATMSYFGLDGSILQSPIIYGEYYAPPAFPQFVNGDPFTLQGLFKWRGERIGPIADANISP